MIIFTDQFLLNPRHFSVTTRLRSANKFHRLPNCTRKYQTFISTLCLITELHKHSTVYFSILFRVLYPSFLFDRILTALSIAVYVFILYCVIWSYAF